MKNKENLRHFMTQPQRPIDSVRESLGKFLDFLCVKSGSLSVNKKRCRREVKNVKLSFLLVGGMVRGLCNLAVTTLDE